MFLSATKHIVVLKQFCFQVCTSESYSTIVLYSRDHQGLGVAHKEISLKNQPHFSHDDVAVLVR